MDIAKLRQQLEIDEGVRYQIYLDSKGLPTFGIGHLLLKTDIEYPAYKNNPGANINVSKERVEEVFEQDIKNVINSCRTVFEDFDLMVDELQQIIANMMFNLGLNRFEGFKKFIQAIKDNYLTIAAAEMQNSSWFEQVGDRAKRLQARMLALANLKAEG